MKTKLINSFGIVLVVASLAFCSGCSTTATTNPANQAAVQALVQSAASTAVILEVQKHPNEAPLFAAGANALSVLDGSSNQVTLATINSSLAAAGQTNALLTVTIANAINLASAYVFNSGTNTPSQVVAVKNVLGWLATGINEGLELNSSLTNVSPVLFQTNSVVSTNK